MDSKELRARLFALEMDGYGRADVSVRAVVCAIIKAEGRAAEIEFALPGHRETLGENTYLRLEDPDPPYTSNHWANVETGEIVSHWSYLTSRLRHEQTIHTDAWTPVADSLPAAHTRYPDRSIPVLAWTTDEESVHAYLVFEDEDDEARWKILGRDFYDVLSPVTHWRYLPVGPKISKEGLDS